MKNPSKIAAIWAGTSALALLLSVSAFADSRPQNEAWRHDRNRQGDSSRESRATAPAQSQNLDSSQREARIDRSGQAGRGSVDRSRAQEQQRSDQYDNRGQSRNDGQYRQGQYDNRGQNRNDGQYRQGQYDNSGRGRNDGQYRNQPQARSGRNDGQYRQGGHDGRISELGHIRSFRRERDGYRIYLDRGGYSYWIPESRLRGRRLSIGLAIRLGGIFRGGLVDVDVLGWPGDPYYNDPYSYDPYNAGRGYGYGNDGYGYGNDVVRGVVERVDYRTGTLLLRDGYRGALVTVDMRGVDRRYSRLDLGDIRPGDRLTLAGSWMRGGYFGAVKIDTIDAY